MRFTRQMYYDPQISEYVQLLQKITMPNGKTEFDNIVERFDIVINKNSPLSIDQQFINFFVKKYSERKKTISDFAQNSDEQDYLEGIKLLRSMNQKNLNRLSINDQIATMNALMGEVSIHASK